jgi:hypothetical protein
MVEIKKQTIERRKISAFGPDCKNVIEEEVVDYPISQRDLIIQYERDDSFERHYFLFLALKDEPDPVKKEEMGEEETKLMIQYADNEDHPVKRYQNWKKLHFIVSSREYHSSRHVFVMNKMLKSAEESKNIELINEAKMFINEVPSRLQMGNGYKAASSFERHIQKKKNDFILRIEREENNARDLVKDKDRFFEILEEFPIESLYKEMLLKFFGYGPFAETSCLILYKEYEYKAVDYFVLAVKRIIEQVNGRGEATLNAKKTIESLMNCLGEKEKRVMSLRYGLCGEKSHTFAQISKIENNKLSLIKYCCHNAWQKLLHINKEQIVQCKELLLWTHRGKC